MKKEDEQKEIIKLRNKGYTIRQIMKKVGIKSMGEIWTILKRAEYIGLLKEYKKRVKIKELLKENNELIKILSKKNEYEQKEDEYWADRTKKSDEQALEDARRI